MPSPQLENGYLQIAREIAEALCRMNLSAYESRVLWFIFLKTYGFKKKMDWIALSQFAKSLGIDRRLVHRALRSLSSKKMTVIYRDDALSSKEIHTKETLTKENTILAVFERGWSIYPKRAGGNSKKKAFASWKARVRAGTDQGEMIAGLVAIPVEIHAAINEAHVSFHLLHAVCVSRGHVIDLMAALKESMKTVKRGKTRADQKKRRKA